MSAIPPPPPPRPTAAAPGKKTAVASKVPPPPGGTAPSSPPPPAPVRKTMPSAVHSPLASPPPPPSNQNPLGMAVSSASPPQQQSSAVPPPPRPVKTTTQPAVVSSANVPPPPPQQQQQPASSPPPPPPPRPVKTTQPAVSPSKLSPPPPQPSKKVPQTASNAVPPPPQPVKKVAAAHPSSASSGDPAVVPPPPPPPQPKKSASAAPPPPQPSKQSPPAAVNHAGVAPIAATTPSSSPSSNGSAATAAAPPPPKKSSAVAATKVASHPVSSISAAEDAAALAASEQRNLLLLAKLNELEAVVGSQSTKADAAMEARLGKLSGQLTELIQTTAAKQSEAAVRSEQSRLTVMQDIVTRENSLAKQHHDVVQSWTTTWTRAREDHDRGLEELRKETQALEGELARKRAERERLAESSVVDLGVLQKMQEHFLATVERLRGGSGGPSVRQHGGGGEEGGGSSSSRAVLLLGDKETITSAAAAVPRASKSRRNSVAAGGGSKKESPLVSGSQRLFAELLTFVVETAMLQNPTLGAGGATATSLLTAFKGAVNDLFTAIAHVLKVYEMPLVPWMSNFLCRVCPPFKDLERAQEEEGDGGKERKIVSQVICFLFEGREAEFAEQVQLAAQKIFDGVSLLSSSSSSSSSASLLFSSNDAIVPEVWVPFQIPPSSSSPQHPPTAASSSPNMRTPLTIQPPQKTYYYNAVVDLTQDLCPRVLAEQQRQNQDGGASTIPLAVELNYSIPPPRSTAAVGWKANPNPSESTDGGRSVLRAKIASHFVLFERQLLPRLGSLLKLYAYREEEFWRVLSAQQGRQQMSSSSSGSPKGAHSLLDE